MAEILDGDHVVTFTWFANIDLPDDISSVELLLAPARSVWDDNFTESSYMNNSVSFDLTLRNGVFSKSISLKSNIYHYLFRVNNANDLTASCKHDVTYLANGRMVNYVNVGDDLSLNKQNLNDGL